MYIYSTPAFDRQVEKHQLNSKVQRLCQELEGMDFSGVQTRFERLYPYLKRKEGNFRLIARLVSCSNENVLCWLQVFNRGDRSYDDFLRDRVNYADCSLERNLQDNLAEWLKTQKVSHAQIITPPLPDNLRIWLNRPSWEMELNTSIIYESEIWFTQFQTAAIHQKASVFRQLVEDLVSRFDDGLGRATPWSQIRLYGNGECYVLYSSLTTIDCPPRQVLFLIAPYDHLPLESEIASIVKGLIIRGNGSNWWKNRHALTIENLISVAKRAYPSYLLAAPDFWLAIEDGDGVNLALSSEEKAILHSVSTQQSLPLFLNGRAGSGKSTMLFYLFTDYCDRYWQYCRETQQDLLPRPHPLFLTYNQALSDFARNKVQSLLRYNYRFLAKNELDSIPDISRFFQSFRPFLISLLPKEIQAQFSEENYVSFHRFRQLCMQRKQNNSPEKCWQVIRSFIKGYYLDERNTYASVLDYQEVPKKEKTVNEAEFKEIYHNVWQWYEEYVRKNHLWDDQDLIRIVLSQNYYRSQYTAIFCDEAQDFTRLELQLIMRLSVFSRYDLQRENVISLPFAFAGDPLQTLNPTGFRWDSLKSAFYSEVLAVLLPNTQTPLTMNFKELQYNYRSVDSIVKVNNLIQLWRKILFSLSTIKPQQARKFSSFNPQKFIIDHPIKPKNALVDILQDTLIIIPCDEGGERDFIIGDEILSKLWTSETSETPWNILSAIAAKGLEFTQVILYKFGEHCPDDLWQFKQEPTAAEKYFLNKLYVAASRATEKLFILDSLAGETKLWSKASNQEFISDFLTKISSDLARQEWQENIQLIHQGIYPEQMNNNNIAEIAATFESEGINNQNPELLRRARHAYQRIDDVSKVTHCLAWQLKLEQQYLAAGKEFLRIANYPEAYACFWQSLAWQQLLELHQTVDLAVMDIQITDLGGDLVNCICLLPLIKFMSEAETENSQQAKITNLLQFTDFLQTQVKQKKNETYSQTKPWRVALKIYQQQITNIIESSNSLTSADWEKIANISSNLKGNHPQTLNLVGECFYAAQNYTQAINYWEAAHSLIPEISYSAKYYLALANITELPAALTYLNEAQAYQKIIDLWINSHKSRDRSWLQYVAIAFERLGHLNNALIIYCYLDNLPQVSSCWQKITQHRVSLKQLVNLLKYYIAKQHWLEAIAFWENLPLKIQQTPVQYYFIALICRSQLTPEAINKPLRQRYEKLLTTILSNSQWQKYLSVPQIGVTLEKVGSLVFTLSFYEHYTNSGDSLLRLFSRQRWLATKQKQVNYLNSSSQNYKARKNHQQLLSHALNWQMSVDSVELLPSQPIPQKFAKVKVSSSELQPRCKIFGLPKQVNLENLPDGSCQFRLHHLQITIMSSTQQVTIVDLKSDRLISLKMNPRQINLDTITITSQSDQPLFFNEEKANYQITLGNHPSNAIELDFANSPEKIIIELSQL
ncbi:MAG: hypothetical protein ACFCU5_10885 [Pleurocapsa sp.]